MQKRGRKSLPPSQKKKQLNIMVEQWRIDAIGCETKAKLLAVSAIENETDMMKITSS